MSSSLRAALAAFVFMLCAPGLALAKAGVDAGAGAPATLALDACSWDRPGVNPFMGDVVAAVDRYRDIPPVVRERLKVRMAQRDYEDIVSITRDNISGNTKGRAYGPTISEMHFGTHQLCHSVTRSSWTPSMQERGLVYCESGHCILVPTVCRNVSRISRREVSPDHAEAVLPPVGLGDDAADGEDPLAMDGVPSFVAPIVGDGPAGGAAGSGAGLGGLGGTPGGGFAGVAFAGAGLGGGGGGGGGLSGPLASGDNGDAPPLTPVPEPQTWALMALGLVGLGLAKRRSASRARPASRA